MGPGEPHRLTTQADLDGWPSWSPDGQYIAFLRDVGGGKAAVLLIPALGGVERKLTQREGDFGHWISHRLAWSPDSQWLIFSDTAPAEEAVSLFVISVSTRETRRLTSPPKTSGGDRSPSISPDGRSVVFVRGESNVGDVYSLVVSEELTAQGEPRKLSSQNVSPNDPVWTPDGREIVFRSGREFGARLWRSAASGSDTLKPLTFAETGAVFPAVSRQGHRLVYSQRLPES
ncbi:MAG: hypothetical protein GY953_38605, partial [bacterium]|nr:hypothetical protein [bacterium]